MGFLTDYVDNDLAFKGKRYKVNPAYDAILNIQRMFKDETCLSDYDKLNLALGILVPDIKLDSLSSPDKVELFQEIYKKHVYSPRKPARSSNKRMIDFELDGCYIYASFLMDYGIDLIDVRGELPWKKFIALFDGLSSGTKINEVMKIRNTDIPEPTKYNQKERQRIIELKEYYALPIEGCGGQEGLDALFGTLEGMAKK